jgi:hypothetical protein
MKAVKIILTLTLLSAPLLTFAQQQDTLYYKKKVKRTTTSTTVNDILRDTINRESGPILNDNGNVNTTGTIDGRSSTGRNGSDTLTNSTVRKSRKTIRNVERTKPDTAERRKRKP